MLQLLPLMILLQTPGPGAADRLLLRDRIQGATPVTDKFLLPPKLHDCRTDEDVRAALEARRYGDREPCDPDPLLRRTR
jgi:hypothetical protein